MHACVHTQTYTHTYAQTCMHVCTYRHAHTYAYTHRHTHVLARTHTLMGMKDSVAEVKYSEKRSVFSFVFKGRESRGVKKKSKKSETRLTASILKQDPNT